MTWPLFSLTLPPGTAGAGNRTQPAIAYGGVTKEGQTGRAVASVRSKAKGHKTASPKITYD